MGGSESIDFLAPAEAGENTLVTCERGDYAADLEIARGIPARRRTSRAPDAPPRSRRPGSRRSRSSRAARRRPCGDVEGDARRDARGGSRPRARAGRRPPRRGEAGSRSSAPRSGLRPRTRSGRVRRRPRLPRPGGLRRGRRRRRGAAARASTSPAPTAPAGTCGASRPGVTSSRGSQTSASRMKGDTCPAMRRAAPLPDCDRGRPHLQARYPLLGAVRRCLCSTRTERSGRSSWDATASGRPGS